MNRYLLSYADGVWRDIWCKPTQRISDDFAPNPLVCCRVIQAFYGAASNLGAAS